MTYTQIDIFTTANEKNFQNLFENYKKEVGNYIHLNLFEVSYLLRKFYEKGYLLGDKMVVEEFQALLKKFNIEVEVNHIDRMQSEVRMPMLSKWTEICDDYADDEENCFSIDGYLTDNPDEEGKVIAKVYICGSKGTVYLDEDAKTDVYAQEVIANVIAKIEKL